MSYLEFDKMQLVNLDYSLSREILRSNRAGSYISTTLNGCNTRKYHGLLVTPIKELGGEKHVLLSSLDPTVIQHGSEFNLGIHRYQGGFYEPNGHKYIRNITFDKIPKIVYRVGGVVLSIERILIEQEQQVIIRYTLEEANSPTTLRLRPFLAFRGIHNLSKANLFVNQKYTPVKNGIKIRLYDSFPYLHMQLNKKCDYIPVPDWYYNIEYLKEKNRGYEYLEDLYVPGYFEVQVKKGESVLFSASTSAINTLTVKRIFSDEVKKRGGRDNFHGFMTNAAEQFILKKENATDIIAGFPWYGSVTRQTFVALPGIAEATENFELISDVLNTYVKHLKYGTFPKSIDAKKAEYHSADAPLWFFWTLQQSYKKQNNAKEIWERYGSAMKRILKGYQDGLPLGIRMYDNGLINIGDRSVASTWMDSNINGNPVIARNGFVIEVNALWYNAICFALEMARQNSDTRFIHKWEDFPEMIQKSIQNIFWKESGTYPADFVTEFVTDMSVRPNMVIAVGLDYCPFTKEQQKSILSVARNQLLTPRGLRTLSPEDPKYKGIIEGSPDEREVAAHQGAVWPWLIRFFVEGYLKIHRRGGLPFVKKNDGSF